MHGARSVLVLVAAAGFGLVGCGVEKLIGGMAQNFEYQKVIEVHPAYDGLEHSTVAVVVDADLSTLYEHPDVSVTIASNVSRRIQAFVPGAEVMPPGFVSEWQFRTPQWSAMPYGEIAARLRVDRVVFIDVYEFRLNPPGNRWLWEGVCAANVGIIERDGFEPDAFVENFAIESSFPPVRGVGRESADAARIQTGVLTIFIEKVAWLFYTHFEAKYPDKYQGEVPKYVPPKK
jgi:hypothetical protein